MIGVADLRGPPYTGPPYAVADLRGPPYTGPPYAVADLRGPPYLIAKGICRVTDGAVAPGRRALTVNT